MTNPNSRHEPEDVTGEIVRSTPKPLTGAIVPEIAVEMIEELAPMVFPHHPGTLRPPIAYGL